MSGWLPRSPFDPDQPLSAPRPATPSAASAGAQDGLSVLERKPELGDLLEQSSFLEVCKSLVDLYRIGIKVFDHQGRMVVDLAVGNAEFCGYVFQFAPGQKGCTSTVARVKSGPIQPVMGSRKPGRDGAPPGTIVHPCFTGLRYLVMPLSHEGDSLGRVVYGPFWPEDLAELPRELDQLLPGFDRVKANKLLEQVRRAPEPTVVKLLQQFAKVLEALIVAGQKSYLTAQVHLEATKESYRELQEKNRALEASLVQLRELDRLKSAFLATVSHELRTPLTSIIGYSEMLSEGMAGPMNPEQKDYVGIIMEKGETLLSLISNILDLTQIEAGKLRLQFEPTDIAAVVKSSLSSVSPQFHKKGVKLSSIVPAMVERPVVDREKLRQIVVNLLANALKFTPLTQGEVQVVLAPKVMLDNVPGFSVTVIDNGVGIPAEHQERVFDSFFQVDNSSTREYGGVGLGLAIVRSYVRAHGGRVTVQSVPGKGAQFSVVFPYQPRPTSAPRSPFE
jgi:signal transduction histidine kinase